MTVNTTTWRTRPHTTDVFMFIHKPSVVFACSINQAIFLNPVPEFAYDNVTVGAYTDVKDQQLVKFMNSDGEFKAWGRIRQLPTSSKLYIGHTGTGDYNIAENDLVEVLDDYRPMPRIPKIIRNKRFVNDWDIEYDAQNEDILPKCNAGGPVVGFVDPDDDLLHVSFDLTRSFAIASGATLISNPYTGDLIDGSVVSGTIASGIFTATFPEGKRWCEFTVEDSRGSIGTIRVLVRSIGTDRSDIFPIIVNSHQIDITNGNRLSFTINSVGQTETEITPGALCIMFAKEAYGTTQGSLTGPTGRENIKFVGWLTEDNIDEDADDNNISYTALDLIGKLSYVPAFPFTLQNKANPNNWNEIEGLSLLRFINYLLTWFTNVTIFTDLWKPAWDSIYTETPKRLDADAGNVTQQIKTLSGYVMAEFSADKNGIIRIEQNAQYLSDEAREDIVTTISLTAADIENAQWSKRHDKQVYWLRGSGVVADVSSITAFLSISPGSSPGSGAREDSLDQQLIIDQADLNIRTGRQYALDNMDIPELTMSLPAAGQILDPANGELVQITLPAELNKRAGAFSNTMFVIKSANIGYETAGYTTEEWTLEPLVYGTPGITQKVPTNKISNITYSAPTPDTYKYTAPKNIPVFKPRTPVPVANSPAVLLFCDAPVLNASKLMRLKRGTTSWETLFTFTATTVEDLGLAYTPTRWNFIGVKPDPFNPASMAYLWINYGNNATFAAIIEMNGLDLPVGQQTLKLVYDSGGLGYNMLGGFDASARLEGLVAGSLTNQIDGKTYCLYRTSRTGAFKLGLISNGRDPNICSMKFGYHPTSLTVGDVYFHVTDEWNNSRYAALYKSTNNGVTWSLDEQLTVSSFSATGSQIKMPSFGNPDDEIVYFRNQSSIYDATVNGLMRRNTDGSVVGIVPYVAALDPAYPIIRAMATSDQDAAKFVCFGYFGSTAYAFRTTDYGDTWEEITPPDASEPALLATIYPYDEDAILVRCGAKALISNNLFSASAMSVTWTDITHDIQTVAFGSVSLAFHGWRVWY